MTSTRNILTLNSNNMKIAQMMLFISVFVGIYGGFHVYTYYKLKPFFYPHLWLLTSILSLLGSSVFPVLALVRGNVGIAIITPLAFVTFIWMGLVFIFFAISVPLDVVAWVIGKTRAHQIHAYLISPGRTTVIGICTVVISVYGYWASLQINIERLTFESSKISMPITVVQISDLHLGLLSDESYCRNMVNKINSLNVDIVVSTGDLLDSQVEQLNRFGELMSGISARYGKYAILGNHEALAGVTESRKFIERAGFTLLSNNGVTIVNTVNLIGVDDPAVNGNLQKQSDIDEATLLKPYDNGRFTILLKHQPVVDQKSGELFDLQLSGHTHGGQIFPFNLLVHLFYKAPFGLTTLDNNSWLYVSRGTGTWGPPMRVLARPEITLYSLLHGNSL